MNPICCGIGMHRTAILGRFVEYYCRRCDGVVFEKARTLEVLMSAGV